MIFLQLTALAVIVGAEYNAEREERMGLVAKAEAEAAASPPAEPLSLGKAVAGLTALFLLGRSAGGN